jgi:hypothetical protein
MQAGIYGMGAASMNPETLVVLLCLLIALRYGLPVLRFVLDSVLFTWHQRRTHQMRRRLIWRR